MRKLTKLFLTRRYLRTIGTRANAAGIDSFLGELPISEEHGGRIRYLGPKIDWDLELRERLRIRLLVRFRLL